MADKPAPAVPDGPAEPAVIARYTGDGSVFQSNVPNRDITTADGLDPELVELAVATGTHTRA